MNIAIYAGRQAGLITLLSILAKGHSIKIIIPEDDIIKQAASNFQIKTIDKNDLNNSDTINLFKNEQIDLFIYCNGLVRPKKEILKFNSINIQPCLYKYRGANPIGELIADNNTRASVGIRHLKADINGGETIIEEFKEVTIDNPQSIYNQLYPLYSTIIIKYLDGVSK